MSTFPSGPLTPLGATLLTEGTDEHLWYTSQDGFSQFYLKGALSPLAPGIPGQDGIICKSWKGWKPPFKHKDLQAAQQDGTTWTASVYDPAKITMQLEAHAATAAGLTQVINEWEGAWDPRQVGTLEHIITTTANGFWSAPVRLDQTWVDEIKYDRRYLWRPITHVCRIDGSFWQGPDSIDTFASSSGNGPVWLTNTGTQPAWLRYLCYGPGSFAFQDGFAGTSLITFGPLLAGQIALVSTQPRLRSVVDLTPGQIPPGQHLNAAQQLLGGLISFAFNNNIPPLLQQFESLFGILPPQGSLNPLLSGTFTNPLPGVSIPQRATPLPIGVGITGGSGASKIVAAITPQRIAPA